MLQYFPVPDDPVVRKGLENVLKRIITGQSGKRTGKAPIDCGTYLSAYCEKERTAHEVVENNKLAAFRLPFIDASQAATAVTADSGKFVVQSCLQ